MCGIFCLLNNTTFDRGIIQEQFEKGKHRGPEYSCLQACGPKCMLGFHRLAINGLNDASHQPITIGDISLICNGEIYNYKQLYSMMQIEPTTQSDCEVIIHLYKKYGMSQTLRMIDGVFSFILYDANIYGSYSKLYAARDPFGVRPLYTLSSSSSGILHGFASEIKMLSHFQREHQAITHFSPGTYSKYILPFTVSSDWILKKKHVVYHTIGCNNMWMNDNSSSWIQGIQDALFSAVKKRVLITERPIACLLSGGLDSSVVTALVQACCAHPVETYSIGLADSEDIVYARMVAEYLGTKHTEVILTEEDFFNAIPHVIRDIESYDTTTVRASIGNYLIGKYISENSDAKVIFNGDGSDELCGGYLYMHACPDPLEFDRECRRLLHDIHAFDVLRSDKCISSHGLEPRTPFLDRAWVQYYMSLSPTLRFHPGNQQCEKFLLRTAFSKKHFIGSNGKPLLPDAVLWRVKEAFSDGVSKKTRSLFTILQEKIPPCLAVTYQHNPAETNEKQYYRNLFEELYPRIEKVVPYFWMPKYIEATDASARTLPIYSQV